MPNWFEDNPTKSVIGYTLIVAGATWAASTFILQDNRLNLAKSELEAQKSISEQYKSKIDLLQRETDALRSDNSEYRTWLGKMQDAIPVIVPRLNELKTRIAQLEDEARKINKNDPSGSKTSSEQSVSLGHAYIDNNTGLILAVKKISIDRTAQLIINFPDKNSENEFSVSAGKKWAFAANGKRLSLIVTEILWVGDLVRFNISEIK